MNTVQRIAKNTIALIFIAILLYFGFSYLIKSLSKEDFDLLKEIIEIKRKI